MNQTYRGGWKPGDVVTIRQTPALVANLWGRHGVVADADGNLERALQPGEVPVRIAQVMATRIRDAETVVYLMQPEWIEEAVIDATQTHQQGN